MAMLKDAERLAIEEFIGDFKTYAETKEILLKEQAND